MANEIRTGDPVDPIKDVVRSSMKVPEFYKHLKKYYRLKHCGNNYKDEDNSPKPFVSERKKKKEFATLCILMKVFFSSIFTLISK